MYVIGLQGIGLPSRSSSSGFGALAKETSTCGKEELGIKPLTHTDVYAYCIYVYICMYFINGSFIIKSIYCI